MKRKRTDFEKHIYLIAKRLIFLFGGHAGQKVREIPWKSVVKNSLSCQ